MHAAQRKLDIARDHASDAFLADLLAFRAFGRRTETFIDGGIPYFVNEYWTARQRQSHALHEVSYRACFKAELPRFFIARLSAPGDLVYDPFMGRGTTLLEAALMGRRGAGNDINPLSRLLIRPRLTPPPLDAIARRLGAIDWRADITARDRDLLVFFHPDTLAEIVALRRYLREREAAGAIDAADDWIRMVAIGRLTGHSSGFFSVYTLPPNQAVAVAAQRKINAERKQTPPRRAVPALILKKSRSLLRDGPPVSPERTVLSPARRQRVRPKAGPMTGSAARQGDPAAATSGRLDLRGEVYRRAGPTGPAFGWPDGKLRPDPMAAPAGDDNVVLMTGSAWATPELSDASVSLIVTSPPFLDVVDYRADNWLRCWFSGIDPDSVAVDRHKSLPEWQRFVRHCLEEFARVVRPGGHVAFEVGEVWGGKVLLERSVVAAARGLPLTLIGVMVNDQAFTKTANCWGVSNNRRGTNTNRIVVFRRD